MSHQRADRMSELSYAQEHEYWQQRKERRPAKILQLSERIEGALDIAALHRALSTVVALHEALRLRIGPAFDGRPVQWLADPPTPSQLLTARRVQARSPEQFGAYVARLRARALSEPFDLTSEPPFRFQLFRYSEQLHAFTADLPALTADGTSRSLFRSQLWDAYGAALAGQDYAGNAEREGLFTAIRRVRERFAERSATVNHRYWSQKFETMAANSNGSPGKPEDRAAREISEESTTHTIVRYATIPESAAASIRQRSRELGATLFQYVLAHFARTCFRRTARAGLAMTVPLDTRGSRERATLGKFTLGLWFFIERSEEFTTLLRQIGSDVLQTMRHRHISYDDLRRAQSLSHGARSGGVPAEVTVRYTLHDEHPVETGPDGLHITHNAFAPEVRYPCDGIAFAVDDFSQRVGLTLFFDPRDFSVADANRFTADLTAALGGALRPAPARALTTGDSS